MVHNTWELVSCLKTGKTCRFSDLEQLCTALANLYFSVACVIVPIKWQSPVPPLKYNFY